MRICLIYLTYVGTVIILVSGSKAGWIIPNLVTVGIMYVRAACLMHHSLQEENISFDTRILLFRL